MKKLFLIVMLAVITALSLNAVVGCKKKKVDSASDSTSMMIDDSVKFVGGSESAQQSEETSLKGSESVKQSEEDSLNGSGESVEQSREDFSQSSESVSESVSKLKEFEGVTFPNKTVTYNGSEFSVTVEGLPYGADVQYANNKAIDAGVYNATATIKKSGYKSIILNSILTINKAEIGNITIKEGQEYEFDGLYHKAELSGAVPSGVTATTYYNNVEFTDGVRERGEYDVKVVLSGKNYVEKTITGKIVIKLDLSSLATTVIDSLKTEPEPWGFLPESFAIENRSCGDYSDDYSAGLGVSSIPKNGIGKQLNVVYGILAKTDSCLAYVNKVYGVMDTIKSIYAAFLTNAPMEYKKFEYGKKEGEDKTPFAFTIELEEDSYTLFATVGSVEVTLFSRKSDNVSGAKVKLTESTLFKYENGQNRFKAAFVVIGKAATQIEFERQPDQTVVGKFYECLTVNEEGSDLLNTSAYIKVDKSYTSIVGTKGDFFVSAKGRNCEVYRNSDASLVGTEVRETKKIKSIEVTFNTLWYNLGDIGGLTELKEVTNEEEKKIIHVNGLSTPFKNKKVGGISAKSFSRRYDIEFKEMYFYAKNVETGEYEKQTKRIPMLFVQQENRETLVKDFKETNDIDISVGVSEADETQVSSVYEKNLKIYDEEINKTVTTEEITNYCKA